MTDDDEKQLDTLLAFYGVTGQTASDRFKDYIHKAHKSRLIYNVSQTLGDSSRKQQIESELETCNLRIFAPVEKSKIAKRYVMYEIIILI